MADITFSCPNCGEVLEATDDIIGAVVECPTCDTEFTVPDGEAEAPQTVNVMDAALKAQDEAPAEESGGCPNCAKPLDAESVLCLECGFHQGLGKVIETNFE